MFSFVTIVIHNPSMSFILCLVTTFLITSIHAGHKRVVIRVPQKTKYIHHHTVKKVPIYVLLPEKKPKILEALEEAKPVVRNPCKDKDLHELLSVREDVSTPARNRYEKSEREKPLTEWTEDVENQGAYYANVADNYRTIEEDFPPPPPVNLDDLSFRRINVDVDQNNSFESKQQRGHEEYRQQSVANFVSFTYPPPTTNQNYASYQYKVNH